MTPNVPLPPTSRVAVRPWQVSSHAAQSSEVSGSHSRSITPGKPLAKVATRVARPPASSA